MLPCNLLQFASPALVLVRSSSGLAAILMPDADLAVISPTFLMFRIPASTGVIGCRESAVECRERDLTGRDSDRWLRYVPECSSAASNNTDSCLFRVLSPEGLKASRARVDRFSPFNDVVDGSCYWIGAHSPIYSRDVQAVLGDFLPQNPYWFYVAHGRFDTPWLYLEAFHMCVTLGPLLHHEKKVSLFRARTIVYENNMWSSPLLTIFIPHHLVLPVSFPPDLQELYQYTDRADIEDLNVPPVQIIPRVHRVWERDVVRGSSITERQLALENRLRQSWERRVIVRGTKESQ